MPMIQAKITVDVPDEMRQILTAELGEAIAEFRKLERYLMIGFEDHYCLYFGGERLEKGAFVSVELSGVEDAATCAKMTEKIHTIFERNLGIPANAVFITFVGCHSWQDADNIRRICVLEKTIDSMLEKGRGNYSHRKRPQENEYIVAKEQCGDVLAVCERYCDVTGDSRDWCKLTDLYGLYKGWVRSKVGRKKMPRYKFKDALARLYSTIQFSAQTPRGENVYTIHGICLKNRYWEC